MMAAGAVQQAHGAHEPSYRFDGIYRPVMAACYLRVALPKQFQRFQPPTRQRIGYWAQEGFVAPDGDTWHPDRLLLNFPDLVTCQAIALMREARLSFAKIRQAELYLSDQGRRPWPFAYRDIWYAGWDIVERIDPDYVKSAVRQGQMGWAFALGGMESLRDRLEWSGDSGRALWWEPREGIRLDPEIQFGRPCISGTRIPTSAIWSLRAAGETARSVAAEYKIGAADVERALDWEREVRAVLAATA
jgi:uncharacterized protein (DUF433 family)